MIQTIHSYWAYLILVVLTLAVLKSFFGYFAKRDYDANAFRVSLLTLIVSHIQLLIGILLYFSSMRFGLWSDLGLVEVMKNADLRLYLIEHPIINILAVVLITMGYSKHKKKLVSKSKYKTIAFFIASL